MTTGWTEVTAAVEKPTVPNTDDDHAYRDRTVSRQLLEKAKGLPEALQSAFVPAEAYIFEWKEYWLGLPGVDRLRVGRIWQEPEVGTWFRLKFENQIGLTSIQPYTAGQPTEDPTHLLVVSKKFPTPASHDAFFRSLLDDLYIRAARLPFTIHTPTAIHTSEAIRPPMPLFTLHFLCQHAESLLTALRVIQATPHRRLTEIRERIPLAEATGVDSDVILDILHNPDEWQEAATNLRIAQMLRGSASLQVLQSRAVESFDTPENRFVRHFLQSVLAAADDLPSQPWWPLVSSDRQAMVTRCRAVLQQALNRSPLREAGPMHVLPVGSQVLLRREGYREMLSLWQSFQQGRRPLFAQLRNAIDLRDIATLYEIWVFFALVDSIAEALDVQPVLTIEVSTLKGLAWEATANYGRGRELLYNHGFRQPTDPRITC